MKADITRNTFDPFKHFARVLMQQGRVQLDADWNEQAAIMLHYLRTLAADLIGPQGGPTGAGFEVMPIPITPSVLDDFCIGLGHYYVDGILCEADTEPVAFVVQTTSPNVVIQVDQWTLDGTPFQANQLVEVFDDAQSPKITPIVVRISNPDQARFMLTLQDAPNTIGDATAPKLRRVITYLTQPDYPVPQDCLLAAGDSYLVYLDVSERLVTYVEDDAIREVALDGPDTATRSKVVWQVKAVAGSVNTDAGGKTVCDNFSPTDSGFPANLFGVNRGRLKAMAKQTSASADPCIIPPEMSYKGAENQLYRVEIHRAGEVWDGKDGKTSAATFKWSRENGSVVFPIVSISTSNGTTGVTLENLGRDDRFGLAEGEWVEIQDDTYVLQNRAENLLQVQSIDRTSMLVTLNGMPSSTVGQDATKHPLLRRWDYQEGDPAEGGLQLGSDGAALVLEGTAGAWLSLEDGVQIQFQPPDSDQPNHYRTGDYWLIPARTATGDVEWPTEMEKNSQGNMVTVPLAKPPDGIEHHYAPLAVISVAAGAPVTLTGDCRKQFDPVSTKPA
jgi:hypothetical protein